MTPEIRILAAELELGRQTALDTLAEALHSHDTLASAAIALGVSRATLWRWLARWPHLRPQGWAPVGWQKGRARGPRATQ